MATTTIDSADSLSRLPDPQHGPRGRLVVHASGENAGLMRLDVDLPDVPTADEATRLVKLKIPGEVAPLDATEATGENGGFVISYFSSDIANAGHLPADAVVTWEVDGHEHQIRGVDIESAEEVEARRGPEAAVVPGGRPLDLYPKTVMLLAAIAVAFLLICVVAFLAMG